MILLVAFAFLAGIVTILSPCILPILPIVLSSTVDTTGKRRPLGVVVGFVLSFTFFTLFLTTLVRLIGIPAESLRYLSIIILIIFGLSLFIPQIQLVIEQLFSKLTRFAPQSQTRHGFFGGLIIGLSLGLLWTPCVGPILASVISLALSGTVTAQAFIITFAYATGTAIPMFLILQAGSTALQKIPWLLKNSARIQKGFGIVMILVAIAIFFNLDRRFQTYILNTFPQYGVGLTQLEDNQLVRDTLQRLNPEPMDETVIGKPMSDLVLPKGPPAPEIIPGGAWFNTQPLTLAALKGKVVIIDFWTYSCINCQRTFPYLKKWWTTYKDKGLVIIGVHAPEFEFEKSEKNVAQAIKDFELTYPIVQDNNFATWRAYNNNYWPAKYVIDKDGLIRYTHFGEGEYNETEKVIQELLSEIGAPVSENIDNPEYKIESQTPEIYLGYLRLRDLTPSQTPSTVQKDVFAEYIPGKILNSNTFSLRGEWKITKEYAETKAGNELMLRYNAKNVFLVMRSDDETQVEIYLDNKLLNTVSVNTDRLYDLIKLEVPGAHELKLKFLNSGTQIYAFTFG